MCAPEDRTMYASGISRIASQSSGTTMVGSDTGVLSPEGAPRSQAVDIGSFSQARSENQGPGKFQLSIDTGDAKGLPAVGGDKQWIDLDFVSPKLVKELQRQYEKHTIPQSTNPLAKGAAKFKALIRQSKRGVTIRLRRKIDSTSDEVTDIHLERDYLHRNQPPSGPWYNEKDDVLLPELSGSSNAIHELADTSALQELPSVPALAASPAPTIRSTVSTLPRYELKDPTTESADWSNVEPPTAAQTCSSDEATSNREAAVPIHAEHAIAPAETQEYDHVPTHQRTTSESSIVPTPTRGLSIRVASDEPKVLASAPDSTLIETLIKGLKVAKTMRYETETDIEPSSPTEDEPDSESEPTTPKSPLKKKTRAARRLSPVLKKRQPKKAALTAPFIEESAEASELPVGLSLPRRHTLHKPLPPSATADELWTALLRSQAGILGPEHPWTYQAKLDLALSRQSQHQQDLSEHLAAFHKTTEYAARTLGVHPLVLAFSADLRALERRSRSQSQRATSIPRTELHLPKGLADGESPILISTGVPGSPVQSHVENEIRTSDSNIPRALVQEASAPPEMGNDSAYMRNESTSAIGVGNLISTVPSTPRSNQSPKELPTIVTTIAPDIVPSSPDAPVPFQAIADLYNACVPPHNPQSAGAALSGLVFTALTTVALNSVLWLQRSFGPEATVEPGKVRVRWTCSCGERLHDDFVERRFGAARVLEAYLNRPRTHPVDGPPNADRRVRAARELEAYPDRPVTHPAHSAPSSPASSDASRVFTSSSYGSVPSPQTTLSSNGAGEHLSALNSPLKSGRTQTGSSYYVNWQHPPEPPWLLTCASEDRYTPKLAHIDMSKLKILSDKDLALSLRQHYFHVNRKWYRSLKLRGLTTIEFVQFEVHKNRFTDIRKCPDMPPHTFSDYKFEPGDLLPPVGSQYLLHLFKHPEDYDGETMTYDRAPKKTTGRLNIGVGWGINLVEGFMPDRVWTLTTTFFAFSSLVFAASWAAMRHDIQGAFGVAAWICTLAALAVGWMQACLG